MVIEEQDKYMLMNAHESIDNELIVSELDPIKPGESYKSALIRLCSWSQDVGAYFILDKLYKWFESNGKDKVYTGNEVLEVIQYFKDHRI